MTRSTAIKDQEDSIFGDDEELESFELEDEDFETDHGEFVIHDLQNVYHVEKPGVIRKDNGYLEWKHPKTQEWHRAVTHHNIRKELIERAQALHPLLRYDHPSNPGSGPHDVTSFHIDYQRWGAEREHRPKILYEFDPPPKPKARAKPGFMMYDDMVVLNHQNNPVLNYDIPATLSSITPGALMEAWKRMFGLGQEDLRARMVRYTFKRVGNREIREAFPHKNTSINMNLQRFRDRAGCVAWLKRQSNHRHGILKLMKSEGVDPLANGNIIEPFGRDLSIEEQKEVMKGARAFFPNKGNPERTDASNNIKSRTRSHEEPERPKSEVDKSDATESRSVESSLDREFYQNTRPSKKARLGGGKVKNPQGFQSPLPTERQWESRVFLQMGNLAPVAASSYQTSPVYLGRAVSRVEEYYAGLLPYEDNEDHLQNHRRMVSEYLGEELNEDDDGLPIPTERPRMLGDPED